MTTQRKVDGKKTVYLVRIAHRPMPGEEVAEGGGPSYTENEIWRQLGAYLAKVGLFVESVEEQR